MESTAMGLLSGINAYRYAEGKRPVVPPPTTAMGALVHYITHSLTLPFQPMNINFGLFPPFPGKSKGRRKTASFGEAGIERDGRVEEES